jgi:hypothetical protein
MKLWQISEVSMVRTKRRKTSRPPPSNLRESGLVPLSCPDCFGVLRFEREGPHGHLLYRCQVDHRYSIGSLLHAKEAQVERTLWSASLLLKQTMYAYEDLLGEMSERAKAERKRIQQRINEVREQGLAIRKMIEASHAIE